MPDVFMGTTPAGHIQPATATATPEIPIAAAFRICLEPDAPEAQTLVSSELDLPMGRP